MPSTLLSRWVVAAAVAITSTGAGAATYRTEYSASLTGLPVGSLKIEYKVGDQDYSISGTVRVRGVLRLFANGKGEASASGQLGKAQPRPEAFRYHYVEDDDDDRVSLDFSGQRVTAIEPPLKKRKKRVPITEEHLSNVVDPLSAVLISGAEGADKKACARRLPIFDGKNRYDLALSYKRTETFKGGDGSYSGPAIVCSARYVPVAGHREDGKDVAKAERSSMEIWLAPLGDTGVMIPVKARIGTSFGPLVIEAKRLTGV